jgi:RNAse (barnase) inhibitor barstar
MTPFLKLLLKGDRGRVATSVQFEPWHPELLAEFGFGIDVVDFAGVGDKESTMARIAEALELPEWFGRNWDALDETLGDRYCRSSRVLVLNHLETLVRADRRTTATLLQVAGDAVAETGSLVLAVGLPTGSEPGSDQGGQAPE